MLLHTKVSNERGDCSAGVGEADGLLHYKGGPVTCRSELVAGGGGHGEHF